MGDNGSLFWLRVSIFRGPDIVFFNGPDDVTKLFVSFALGCCNRLLRWPEPECLLRWESGIGGREDDSTATLDCVLSIFSSIVDCRMRGMCCCSECMTSLAGTAGIVRPISRTRTTW